MTHAGYIKRVDLTLRAHYLGIKTQIFEVAPDQFEIYCHNFEGNFYIIKNHFDQSIKGIIMPVELTDKKPKIYLSIVKPFDEGSFTTYEGEAFTKVGLLNLLMGKFPNVFFKNIQVERDILTIYTCSFSEILSPSVTEYRFLNLKDRDKILNFMERLELPFSYEIIEEKSEGRPDLTIQNVFNSVQFIYASNFPHYKPVPYEQRDEALWYDKIEDINAGKFNKDDFYFYNAADYSCYADYSSFPNIDVRNLLLLFQTVYITPPIEWPFTAWLNKMNIHFNDFADLVKNGRIRLVLTQPKERYIHNGWFNEVFQDSPNHIISRRAIGAFLQHDIVTLADNYILKDFYDEKMWMDFLHKAKPIAQFDPRTVYERLMWPLKAKRMSFQYLNEGGLLKTAAFGINRAVQGLIPANSTNNLQFEFDMAAPSVHLSNALNSIYFPFKTESGYSDSVYANILGNMLNMYRNISPGNLKELNTNSEKIEKGINELSPVDLFEFDKYISLQEVEKILTKNKAFPRGKRLFESLATLSPENRMKKITDYNNKVRKAIAGKGVIKDSLDFSTNIVLDGIGQVSGFGWVGSIISLLKILASKSNINSSIPEKLKLKLEEASYQKNPDKANIHFLTQINRVARLKENF